MTHRPTNAPHGESQSMTRRALIACAALVAMAALGRTDSRATVALPGGELRIRWDEPGGEVHQAGPAAYAFAGRWPEDGEPL